MEDTDRHLSLVPDLDEDTNKLALDSIIRWTFRRDEYTDPELIRIIRKVASTALGVEITNGVK